MLISADLTKLRQHSIILEEELRLARRAEESLIGAIEQNASDEMTVQKLYAHLAFVRQLQDMIRSRKQLLVNMLEVLERLRQETDDDLHEAIRRLSSSLPAD